MKLVMLVFDTKMEIAYECGKSIVMILLAD